MQYSGRRMLQVFMGLADDAPVVMALGMRDRSGVPVQVMAIESPPSAEIATAAASKAKRGKPGAVRNVLTNWGAYVLAMGVNFFLSPYVVHHLGNTGYGVWTVILSLTGYLGLLDLGV